jgi:hypothetical protein
MMGDHRDTFRSNPIPNDTAVFGLTGEASAGHVSARRSPRLIWVTPIVPVIRSRNGIKFPTGSLSVT